MAAPDAQQHRAGGPEHPFHLNRRRVLLSLLLAAALLSGAVALIGQVESYHRLAGALGAASAGWLPLCVLGELLAYAGYILAYRDFARVEGGPVLGMWTVTRVVIIGFGAFVFGSAPGGLAVDYWALERATGARHESARRVLGLNTLEWAVLGVFACAASIVVLVRREDDVATPMAIAWLVVVPTCVGLGLWFTQPGRAARYAGLRRMDVPRAARRRDLRRRARRVAAVLRVGLADAFGGILVMRALLRHPARYPAGTFGFALYWAGDLIALAAALREFGIDLGPAHLVLAYTSAYIITALPLPVGGAGTTEATLAWTLNLVGVAYAPGLLAAAVYRGFAFWLPLGPALAFIPLAGGLAEDLDRARAARHAPAAREPRLPEVGAG
jgi:uncharacterized membrane protein YbhN (UPF0104 family)